MFRFGAFGPRRSGRVGKLVGVAWITLLGLSPSFFALPLPATALAPYTIRNMDISIWPEYDDPGVLVLYTGEYADAAFPREVQFRILKGVEVNSTCTNVPGGRYTNTFNSGENESGEFATITCRLEEPKFHVEYYFNLPTDKPDRSFTYRFQTVDPIDSLSVEVQQPLRSSNFTTSPTGSITSTDKDGLQYFRLPSFSKVEPGKTVEVQVGYTKNDARPSVNPAVNPPTSNSGGDVAKSADVGAVLGIFGVGILGVLGYFLYTGLNRRSAATVRAAPHGARRTRTSAGVYCTSCGASLRETDIFCPACGKKRRRGQQ